MKHPLYVGHFDVAVRTPQPKVKHGVDIDRVHAVLKRYCDAGPDGMPIVSNECSNQWLGQINGESVFFKDGYLICPWLGMGVNKGSVNFISELYSSLGMQVFEPGDCAFYSPQQLADMERDFDQFSDKVPAPAATLAGTTPDVRRSDA